MIEHILVGSLLGICTYTDLKKRKIYMAVIIIWGAAGILRAVIQFDDVVMYAGSGAFTGLIMVLISRFTHEAIGYGDGALLIVTGLCLGGWRNVELLFGGLFLAACVSIILLLCRKATRKTRMPFVPFLLVSYVGMILL